MWQPLSERLDGLGGPLLDLFADLPPFSILSCKQYVVGSEGAIAVQYPAGGRPTVRLQCRFQRTT